MICVLDNIFSKLVIHYKDKRVWIYYEISFEHQVENLLCKLFKNYKFQQNWFNIRNYGNNQK